jgi:hypothetical protein
MKSRDKPRGYKPHYKKAREADFVKVFRIEKQVWDAEVFPEASRHHREEDHPAEQQYDVSLEVVE